MPSPVLWSGALRFCTMTHFKNTVSRQQHKHKRLQWVQACLPHALNTAIGHSSILFHTGGCRSNTDCQNFMTQTSSCPLIPCWSLLVWPSTFSSECDRRHLMFLWPFKSKHDVVPAHLLCDKTELKAVTAHASPTSWGVWMWLLIQHRSDLITLNKS